MNSGFRVRRKKLRKGLETMVVALMIIAAAFICRFAAEQYPEITADWRGDWEWTDAFFACFIAIAIAFVLVNLPFLLFFDWLRKSKAAAQKQGQPHSADT